MMDPNANVPSLQAQVDAITQGIASDALAQVDAAYPLQRAQSPNDPPMPAPAPQQGQQNTQTAPDAGRPDAGRRYAGKYISVDELEKGHVHAQSLITKLQAENAQLRAVPATAATAPVTAPRVNPVQRQVQMSEKLAQFGERNQIPAQELAEVVAEVAREVVREENAPVQAQQEAINYMRQNHPRFFEFQSEVLAHTSANPALQATVARELNNGNYVGGMLTAWSDYALSAGVDVHQRMVANNTVLNQEVEKARIDAGLASTQASGVHESQPDPRFISQERFQQLVEMSRNGYPMPLAREVFGAGLPDEIFGINQ